MALNTNNYTTDRSIWNTDLLQDSKIFLDQEGDKLTSIKASEWRLRTIKIVLQEVRKFTYLL